MATSDKQDSQPRKNPIVRVLLEYVPGVIIPALVALAWSTIFTRVFSEAEYGRYSIVVATAGLAALLGYRWLEQSIIRYVPKENSGRGEPVLEGAAVLGIALVSAAFLFSMPAVFLVSPEWRALVVGGLLLTVASGASTTLLAVLTVREQSRRYSIARSIEATVRLALSAFVVVYFRRDVSVLVWSSVVSHLFILILLAVRLQLPGVDVYLYKLDEVKKGLRKIAKYGLPLSIWFVLANLLTVGDRYVIQWLRGPAEVGVYTANYQLVQGSVMLAFAPVLLALNPRLMQDWESGHTQKTLDSLNDIIHALLAVGMAAVAGVEVLAPYVAHLVLGEAFRDGFRVMPVVLLGLTVWQVSNFIQKPLEFAERTCTMALYMLIAVVLNVATNVIFVPAYGYYAAAWTTAVSYVAYGALVYKAARRIGGPKLELTRLAKSAFITAIVFSLNKIAIVCCLPGSQWLEFTACVLATVLAMFWNLSVTWGREKLRTTMLAVVNRATGT